MGRRQRGVLWVVKGGILLQKECWRVLGAQRVLTFEAEAPTIVRYPEVLGMELAVPTTQVTIPKTQYQVINDFGEHYTLGHHFILPQERNPTSIHLVFFARRPFKLEMSLWSPGLGAGPNPAGR